MADQVVGDPRNVTSRRGQVIFGHPHIGVSAVGHHFNSVGMVTILAESNRLLAALGSRSRMTQITASGRTPARLGG